MPAQTRALYALARRLRAYAANLTARQAVRRGTRRTGGLTASVGLGANASYLQRLLLQQARRLEAAYDVGDGLERFLQQHAPAETGALRDSIVVETEVDTGRVIFFGTRPILTDGRVTYDVNSDVEYAEFAYPKADGRGPTYIGLVRLSWARVRVNVNF